MDGCGLSFIGLFSQDPPCFLFTARLGCSRDSQGAHVAMNRCAACKQVPGLTCVYPTTLIGNGCVPLILPPLKQVSAVTAGRLAKVGGGSVTQGYFCGQRASLYRKLATSWWLFSATKLQSSSVCNHKQTLAATVAAQHSGIWWKTLWADVHCNTQQVLSGWLRNIL